MTQLTIEDFPGFMEEVHGYEPFPWQTHLAETVAKKGWPSPIQMPTGTGKTAAIDIAVFVLALHADNPDKDPPRRIFYTIDRRVVVDQAYQRASKLVNALETALHNPDEQEISASVARNLQSLGVEKPLVTNRLRGGLHRDEVWFDDPAQPAIYTTTVDQVGSRLLFRGYGVSDSMKPVHAGLTGNDALYILDEVHLSHPFKETLQNVEKLRGQESVDKPFQVVTMSATVQDTDRWTSDETRDRDLDHEVLGPRLKANKNASLHEAPEDHDKYIETITQLARDAAQDRPVIGIIVNTVKTARSLYRNLQKGENDAALIIGRSRTYERNSVIEEELKKVATPRKREDEERDEPLFVVATQTIEVGADLDFDALITALAPLDALRQRVGRLDRFGKLGETDAYIVARKNWVKPDSDDQVRCMECGKYFSSLGSHLRSHDISKEGYKEKYWGAAYDPVPEHPIYGRSLKPTWDWLQEQAGEGALDLGFTGVEPPEGDRLESMCSPRKSAPTLLTPHLDLLAQTSPKPRPDPDISLYLHGRDTSPGDVQVVWRNDLLKTGEDRLSPGQEQRYIDTVAQRPPLAQETLELPVWAADRWLRQQPGSAEVPDVEGGTPQPSEGGNFVDPILIWRGPDDSKVAEPGEIEPGDTIVIPDTYGGHDRYAFDPEHEEAVIDVSNPAAADSATPTLALTPRHLEDLLPEDDYQELSGLVLDPRVDSSREKIEEVLETLSRKGEKEGAREVAASMLSAHYDESLHQTYRDTEHGEGYPVLTFQREKDSWEQAALEPHAERVWQYASQYASATRLPEELVDAVETSAKLHDAGKLESRFQIWLNGGLPAPPGRDALAKSGVRPGSPKSRRARNLAGYPRGRRHEAISAQLIAETDDVPTFATYLAGTHHGNGRPFFPAPVDKQTPDRVNVEFMGYSFDQETRYNHHRLSNEWPDLFWSLHSETGPWSIAFLEALIRIADHTASEEGVSDG